MNFIRNVTTRDIEEASRALMDGNLVAFPTETVYGLGADATNQAAVNRMYEVKGRPKNHPVIVHVSSFEKINEWAVDIPAAALELGKKYWPGPLTLVLKRSKMAQDFITGGQDSVAIRVPNHPVALKLLRRFEEHGGKGIVAPSANLFGKPSPTMVAHILRDLKPQLKDSDFVFDGGNCAIGIESTIISFVSGRVEILRPGFITRANIKSDFKIDIKIKTKAGHLKEVRFPGQSLAHYRPKAKIILNGIVAPGDGLIAFHGIETPIGVVRLSKPKNDEQFAKTLYESFRLADRLKLKKVCVLFSKNSDFSEAIQDRLLRASSL